MVLAPICILDNSLYKCYYNNDLIKMSILFHKILITNDHSLLLQIIYYESSK